MTGPADDESHSTDVVGLLEGLTTTRTIRRYTDEPVPDDDLQVMMFAATRAPSGSNRQPFRMLLLTDGPRAVEAKRIIGTAARAEWNAKRHRDAYDSGSGAVGGALTGWHLGVEAALHELLEIPHDVFIAGTVTIGRPEGGHGPVRRRPLRELVYAETWGHLLKRSTLIFHIRLIFKIIVRSTAPTQEQVVDDNEKFSGMMTAATTGTRGWMFIRFSDMISKCSLEVEGC